MSVLLSFITSDLSPCVVTIWHAMLSTACGRQLEDFRLRLLESCPISHHLSLRYPGNYGFVLRQEKQGSAVLYDEELMWKQKTHPI